MHTSSKNKKPLTVAIMGPTASGKTVCALKVAQNIPSEIISVDSALVYRDMDIGTAKPNKEELNAVLHHLINIRDPQEPYSVANFREDATKLIAEISTRKKLPLLVGGTMLYFKGLSDGLDDLPNANPQIRAKLNEEAQKIGWNNMHERLKELDPQTASRLKPNDAQRIQRALEIIEITGKPTSELLKQRQTTELPFKLLNISLEPSDRTQLHKRIERRFDKMLQNDALIEEVKRLRQRGNLNLGLPSIRCVGYRQVWEYLDGNYDKKTMRDKGIFATRQLAKRQLTWLRAMPDRIVVDCLDEKAPQKVLEIIQNALKMGT